MTWRSRHIYLTGLPGSGKTSIGTQLTVLLAKSGYQFIDLDREIERRHSRTIAEIFNEPDGEQTFRGIETALLAELADLNFEQQPLVVATGGGTPLSPLNRQIMRGSGVIVWLDVTVRQAANNVLSGILQGNVRPLLRSSSPEELLEKIRLLANERQQVYEQATLHFIRRSSRGVERSPQELASELLKALEQMSRQIRLRPRFETLIARSAFGDYPISVGSGIAANEIVKTIRDFAIKRITIITDDIVASHHSRKLQQNILKENGENLAMHQVTIDSGEEHKNQEQLFDILNVFTELEINRKDDLIISFGGGTVSDVAGFAASIYKRGIPIIHIPTTLLGQIDAAIGGKTGIEFAGQKNMIGTFYSPRRVIVDPIYLQTLPKRILRSGFSELLKYGLIGNSDLWRRLSHSIRRFLRGLDPGYEILIRDGIKEKLRYVNVDEFERSNGIRELLNFGHTFAHGFESATHFSVLLHGEAVALGMRAASWLSMKIGMLSDDEWREIELTLGRIQVPSLNCSTDQVLSAMRNDKKNSLNSMRLILLESIGKAIVKDNIDSVLIKDAIDFALSAV